MSISQTAERLRASAPSNRAHRTQETEHYEIAAYDGLIVAARAMGEREVVALLSENLEQEKVALKLMQGVGKRLATEGAKAAV